MKDAILDKAIKAAIAAGAVPVSTQVPVLPGVIESLDFGLGNLFKKKPEPPHELTAIEALKHFAPAEAVKMNFIPQMIIALALDETTTFINYCRDKRLSDFKKHNRLMRQCVEEYAANQKKSYGAAYASYVAYVGRYFQRVGLDRAKMWYSVGNTVMKQLPGKDLQIAERIAFIHRLLDYAEDYDRRMDKVIQERMGKPIHRRQDQHLRLITAMCIAIEEDFGYKFEFSEADNLNFAVLTNRASMLADEIIAEEANVSKS